MDNLIDEYSTLMNKINGASFMKLVNFMNTDFPKWLHSVYDKGFEAGLETGKKIKINNLIKNN